MSRKKGDCRGGTVGKVTGERLGSEAATCAAGASWVFWCSSVRLSPARPLLMPHESPLESRRDRSSHFHSTPWSLILRTQESDPEQARAALASLCEHYWYPLYVFVRRKLGDAEQALDATQGFFAHLLEKDLVAEVHPSRGKFRTFLLTCC